MILLLVLLLSLSLVYTTTTTTLTTTTDNANEFSGIYQPYTRHSSETYAGAWLSSLTTLYDRINELKEVQNLEGASFFMIHGTDTLMTRDYFDFFIIHLSSMINILIEYKLSSDVLTSVQIILSNRLRKTIRLIENNNNHYYHNNFNDIIVIIPFSTRKAYYKKEDMDFFQKDIRTLFFELTFWSIYRYIPHIVVTYITKHDEDAINELNLPIWHLKDITNETDHYARQPKESLLYVLNNWITRKPSNNITPKTPIDNWGNFKYIYFTEADEILYIRPDSILSMLSILNKNEHGFKITAYAPHRMQTMPLPKTFPSSVTTWNKSLIIDSLSHIDLVTETLIAPTGSCCDDGRYIFDTCKAWWWYMCHRDPGYNYGAVNYTTWLRFGRSGFTFPTGTEHAGKCSYSNTRITCPIDQSILERSKTNTCEKRLPSQFNEICGEMHYRKNEKIYLSKNMKI